MKSLQDWGLLGEIYIGCGFIRGKLAGIYYDILGRVGGRLAAGVALCKALGARLPGGGIVCSRLSASRSHRKVTVCTPRRRGVPFTRVKGTKTRLGLCPKTPYPLSCGWIRTMLWHRPYGAADTLSRCLRRILFWIQQRPN